MEWKANYLNEVEREWEYGNFSAQEVLALSYLSSQRRQVTDVGLTYLAAFDGRHRSGKSIAASVIAYLWDPTFWTHYENRIVQEPQEFMDVLERIDKEKINGAVIQVDEAGVSMANSEWYEKWMKTLTKTVQMFGYLHPVVFFCAPIKDFVDSRLRRMFHAYYAVSRFTKDYSIIQPYNVHYSTIRNKWYYKKPIIKIAGQNIKLDKIKLGTPPAFIMERYAEYEKGVKGRMLKDFIADMRKDETEQVKKKKDLVAIVSYITSNYKLFETRNSKQDRIVLDKTLLQFKFGLTTNESQYVKLESEKVIMLKIREINESLRIPRDQSARAIDAPPEAIMGDQSDVFK